MEIEQLFGGKTKTDILKYLIFKQEWLSARELESHLQQSFPAIKKQLDNLEKAWIITKNKTANRWQIKMVPDAKKVVFKVFVFDMLNFLKKLLNEYYFLEKFLLGDMFFLDLDMKIWVDLIFVYNNVEEGFLVDVKNQISTFFDGYFISPKVSFLLKKDYEKRLRFADKFVLRLTKLNQQFTL